MVISWCISAQLLRVRAYPAIPRSRARPYDRDVSTSKATFRRVLILVGMLRAISGVANH